MKLTSSNKYYCDKCGDKLPKGKHISLSTFYQSGVDYHNRNPHKVRHLCSYCKRVFDMAFKGFFDHYNDVIKKVKEKN